MLGVITQKRISSISHINEGLFAFYWFPHDAASLAEVGAPTSAGSVRGFELGVPSKLHGPPADVEASARQLISRVPPDEHE